MGDELPWDGAVFHWEAMMSDPDSALVSPPLPFKTEGTFQHMIDSASATSPLTPTTPLPAAPRTIPTVCNPAPRPHLIWDNWMDVTGVPPKESANESGKDQDGLFIRSGPLAPTTPFPAAPPTAPLIRNPAPWAPHMDNLVDIAPKDCAAAP
ncbi:unnamed protein product [Darwinula stevensoni]|uniref:Uncharacterized protein n=1 Tax=Darwinula stevensoni TaxID=69355 RepID=A0A7R9AAL8_9CRUS|nr:unnamed protein product [Darwinula stevensoni]CAG0898147.1 unnamed protein product [Darwinula stevensoni]